MRIDCARCPARNRECDDCMMQVLFDPAIREIPDDDHLEIEAAVSVFVATGLISRTDGQVAIDGVHAGETVGSNGWVERLRAV